MLAMITSEELECRDILNDVGIFFSDDDTDLLAADLSNYGDEFKPITTSMVSSPEMPAKSIIASVSPPTTPEVPTSSSMESLVLLAPNPVSTPPVFSFQQAAPVLPPVLPALLPNTHQTAAVMAAAARIQRAVSDMSMTSPSIIPTTTKSKSRKRSLQGMLQADFDPEEQNRRKRNREHAKKSRLRKKVLTDDLQSTVEALRSETEKLRQELYDKLGEEEVTSILEERKRKEQEQFIAALKQPKNRVLDASALKFLKGLSKKLPKQQGK